MVAFSEAGGYLCIWGQPGLDSEIQNSQKDTMKPLGKIHYLIDKHNSIANFTSVLK